jgi:hypothetical protein
MKRYLAPKKRIFDDIVMIDEELQAALGDFKSHYL